MAIYRFCLNPFCEDRSKTACWVSIHRSHLSAVGNPNPVNQALYLIDGRTWKECVFKPTGNG